MNEPPFCLSYNFTCEELKALAMIARENQDKIPKVLFNFSRKVQDKVYSFMSIDEVEEYAKKEKY